MPPDICFPHFRGDELRKLVILIVIQSKAAYAEEIIDYLDLVTDSKCPLGEVAEKPARVKDDVV